MSRPAGTALAAICAAIGSCGGACGGGGESAPIGSGDATRIRFNDITAASGIAMRLTSGGTPPTQILEVKGGGLALLDHDGDGDRDLFVPNGATLESPERGPGARLFENRGGMRFEDVTQAGGIDFQGWGFGPAVGDLDGDGREDVYVACFGPDALLLNRGGGRLEDRAAAAGIEERAWSTACAPGDLDADGDLDLYVVNYLRFDPAAPPPPSSFLGVRVFAGPAGLEPEPARLWENLGDGSFRDASTSSGCASAPPSSGLGVAILDFDEDGRLDLFVGNDSMRSFLFRNEGGLAFREIGLESGAGLNGDGQAQATMGIAVGDVDGNGLADLYTTNFAGDTNTLHLNRGAMVFDDATQRWGLGLVTRPFLGWADAFADFDLDGDEDLVCFNGHVYPEAVLAQIGSELLQVPLLFERSEAGFRRVEGSAAGAWLSEPHCDRSAVFGDLDGDGDTDIAVGELSGPLRLLRNDSAGGAWLAFELDDARPGHADRRGLGARLSLRAGGRVQTRWIPSGGSYQAASEPSAVFGLPPGAEEWELELRWPDGVTQVERGRGTGRRVRVERNADAAR